jgi:hypothetical protein
MENKKAEIDGKCREIAAALGGIFEANDYDHGGGLITLANVKPGAALFIYPGWRQNGKAEISGRYPMKPDGTQRCGRDLCKHQEPVGDSIGVSLSRKAAAIVTDIKSRLLPRYFELLRRAEEANDKLQEHMIGAANHAGLLCSILNTTPRTNDHGMSYHVNVSILEYETYGEFTVNGSIDLKCSGLNIDQAQRIALIIAEFKKAAE